MVVVIESSRFQLARLLARQHAERDAGFHTQILDQADHFDDPIQVFVGRIAPGSAHTETAGAILPGV